ncbi:hypothetical protein [Acidithiobacillus ferriphilus]|uniref:hypothetical protein n=1 Tax=Acidithiobacillus ferriphilus TaxID=1689834 RepID=UPI002DB793D7|nr:hypothetical protein [Acidithiobacillus ferriphilus]MEB8535525.1 hypothetical protein [Acidithiobacillus ferriphilus]
MDKDKLTGIAIYGVPAVIIGGMMAWHLHLFGLGEAPAASHHAGPASFASAAPLVNSETPAAQAAPAVQPAAPAQPVPTATIAPPATSVTPVVAVSASSQIPTMPGQNTMTSAGLQKIDAEIMVLQSETQSIQATLSRMVAIQQSAAKFMHLNAGTAGRLAPASATTLPKALNMHRSLDGYHLQATGVTEAWLTNPDGETVIVTAGTQLSGGLRILGVGPDGVRTDQGDLGW